MVKMMKAHERCSPYLSYIPFVSCTGIPLPSGLDQMLVQI